ncbi:unnamed protein product [Nezara viridula]|uniref:Major facilitator superfamily (MFS) profile domain-containing protein n=1 Tax=Nezara viridula TaxID=85310 RepID=A0A9P0HPQ1_NEZVI|nr:unnamed protein product [Nezara viridula]
MESKVEIPEESPRPQPTPLIHPRVEQIRSEEQRSKSNSLTSVDFETAISKSGMISSGFVWGFLSDKLGRKKLLVIGFLLDFLMNFLTGLVPSLPFMLVFKYLSGFMVSGPFSIFTAYISEVFLSKRRDIAVLSSGIFSAVGNIIQAALAMWIIPSEVPFQLPLKSWQLFHMTCGIPSLLCGLGCIFCVESPKFLVDHGDHVKALEVKKLQHQISKSDKKKSFRDSMNETVAIFRPPFVKRALLGFIIQFIVVAM